MFPLKTIVYLGLFNAAFLASCFYHPIAGVLAYVVTYNINPHGQWWGTFLPDLFARYSFLLAAAIGIGIVLRNAQLRYRRFWESQEILLVVFLSVVGLSVIVGHGIEPHENITKMLKVVIILLMASHVTTTTKCFDMMLWVFILSGFYLSYEMYIGSGVMRGGRFHGGLGGSDFSEGNFLAAHFAFILPIVGAMFLKGDWKMKFLCLIVGAFVTNSVVMVRSRGAFIALAMGGCASPFFMVKLKQYRNKVVALIIIGALGVIYLTDSSFWNRMDTIQTSQGEERDLSAQGRIDAWRAAWEIAKDYPLGVGVNNFFVFIGLYNPSMVGRDTHNTYLRCLAELGFHGIFVLLLLICNAFRMLSTVNDNAMLLEKNLMEKFTLYVFALRISLVVYLTAAMFISAVYIEEFYWLLMMPVFLKRALENEMENKAVVELEAMKTT